jgi:putative CocE/NonD family hydrolase
MAPPHRQRFPDAPGGGIDRAKSFFDRWLRGVETPAELSHPAITYFEMDPAADLTWRGQWRGAPSWPPPGTSERRLYLDPGSDDLTAQPPSSGSSVIYRYDPADPLPTPGGRVLTPTLPSGPRDLAATESRSDVAVFTTAPLSTELVLAGRPRVELWFSSDRPDTDVTAFLAHVDSGGRSILLAEGVLRLRFRESTARETALVPGKVYPIEVELDHLALRLEPGDRLRLIVSSSNYPKYAKNLNDGGPMYREGAGEPALNQVFGGAERPSALVLPVVEGNV